MTSVVTISSTSILKKKSDEEIVKRVDEHRNKVLHRLIVGVVDVVVVDCQFLKKFFPIVGPKWIYRSLNARIMIP